MAEGSKTGLLYAVLLFLRAMFVRMDHFVVINLALRQQLSDGVFGKDYRFSDKIVVLEGHKLSTGRNNGQMEGYSTSNDGWILFELRKTGRIRKKQIIQRTGHSNSTVSRSLVKLRKDGQIVFGGSPRSGYWRLV